MERILEQLRDAVGAAPRERMLIDLACAVLCIAGAGLIGAAAFHALADAAGAQVARLSLGAAALALGAVVWAVGMLRLRQRKRRAEAARARLAEQARTAALPRGGPLVPVAAFVLAFLTARRD